MGTGWATQNIIVSRSRYSRCNGLKIQLDTGALVGETYNEYDRFGGNQVSLRERWY
jgi:hypothetical protein